MAARFLCGCRISVQALIERIDNGRGHLHRDATITTNDLGEYRLWHLNPGKYRLRALGRSSLLKVVGELPASFDSDLAYVPRYFPSGTTAAEAQVQELLSGATLQCDFQLSARKAYQIRGRIANYSADR